MDILRVSLKKLNIMTLDLGYVGEKEHTRVEIDCTEELNGRPNAMVGMTVESPAGEKYPVLVTLRDGVVVWDISSSDLVHEGNGRIQITFMDGTEVFKTVIGRTKIHGSLLPDSEAPEPIANWMDIANGALGEIVAFEEKADYASSVAEKLEGLTAAAVTLPSTSDASVDLDIQEQTLTFGIPKGEKGEQGIQGPKGNKGDKGDKGETGDQGIQGPKGDKGDTGAQGIQGPKGDKGETGNTGAKGEQGERGEKGDKGDPFVYSDFTQAQLDNLKGPKGDTGETGPKGDKGDPFVYADFTQEQLDNLKGPKGDKGDPFVYADFTQEQLDNLKGPKGDTGETGPKGDPGEPSPVQDVQMDGTSIVTNGIAEITLSENLWLETNNLDSEVGGKVNVLQTPYDYDTDGFLNNSIILASGSIRTDGMANDRGCVLSPLIAVQEGTYGLKVTHNTTIGNIYGTNGGFGLFAADGTTPVSKPSARTELGDDIYLFEVPSTAKYIRFVFTKGSQGDGNLSKAVGYFNQWILLPDADATVDDSFFVVAEKKANGTINKLMRNDGSYLSLVDPDARASAEEALARPITFGRRTCAIFRKVCCIGDSFTEGYIMNSSGTAHADPEYSWVRHLETLTGREYVNCGISGATTASWLTNPDGLAKAQIAANKAQAYIIALQINDAATELSVGTASDIGTSAQTYYGCTSKIIDEMFTINDAAHVFLLTQPKNYEGAHTPYREAVLDIVDWYQTEGNETHQNQVHLIDLLDYYKLFQNPGCSDSSVNGHYTAVGWEYTAEILMYAWSNYINANPLLFQDVNLIPYGTGA